MDRSKQEVPARGDRSGIEGRSLFLWSLRTLLFSGALFVLAMGGSKVHAITTTWTGGGANGNWDTAGNWDLGVPGAGDNALFNGIAAQGSKDATINVNVSITSMSVTSGYTGIMTVLSTTTISLTGSLTQNGGTFNLQGSSSTTVAVDFTHSGGTFTAGTSTVTFSGTGTLTGSTTFYNLSVTGNTTRTIVSTDTMTVTNLLTLGDGVSNNQSINTGTLEAQGDIIQTAGYGGTTGGGDALILIDGTGNQTLTGNGNESTGIPGIRINKAAGTLTLSGLIPAFGEWTYLNGALSVTGSTVTFAFANTISGSHTLANAHFMAYTTTATIVAGTTITVTGRTEFGYTGFTAQINGGAVSAQGNVVVDANYNGGTTQLIFSGSSNQTFDLTGATTLYDGNVTANKTGGQVSLASALVMDASGQTLTITSGTFNLNGQNLTGGPSVTVNNGGDLRLQGGETTTFNGNPTLVAGSSVTYVGTAGPYTLKSWPYSSLTINGSGATFNLGGSLSLGRNLAVSAGTLNTTGSNYALSVSTDVLINGGTLTLNASTMTASGNWTYSSGAFNANTSTVTFNGTATYTVNNGTQTFSHVTFNGSGGTWNLGGQLTDSGNLTVTAGALNTTSTNYGVSVSSNVNINGGTFTLNSSTVNVSGNWTNSSGTFNYNTSTVTFTGVAGSTQTLAGSTTFYNLKAVTGNVGFNLPAASTQTVTNILTLTGSSGNVIKLRSSTSGSYAFLANTGTNNVSYVDAKDSNASGGGTIVDNPGGVDSGNNVNWVFAAASLGISVNVSTYNFGSLPVSSAAVSTSAIQVTNNGNVIEDFSLNASSTTNWFLGNSTSTIAFSTFTIMGVFAPSIPTLSTFTVYDVMLSSAQTASGNYFVINGSTETGTSVAVNGLRHLWFRLDTPSSSSSSSVQTSTVTITASQSP